MAKSYRFINGQIEFIGENSQSNDSIAFPGKVITQYSPDGDNSLEGTSLSAPTGRGATYVIAASNSSDQDKAQANVTCPLDNPEVTLQAAFTANAGKKIVLLPGTYIKGNVTGLTIPSNTTIEIQGTIQLAPNVGNDPYIFACDTVTDIHILGTGILDGNRSNQTTITGLSILISWTSVTNSEISGITVKEAATTDSLSGYGIYLNNSANNRITRIYAYHNGRQNICLFDNSNYCTVSNCISENAGYNNYDLHNVWGCTYTGNISLNGNGAFDLNNASYCTITGNFSSGGYTWGVYIEGDTSSIYNVISSNVLRSPNSGDVSGYGGIVIASTGSYNKISNNKIYNAKKSGIKTSGTGDTISNNDIHGSGIYGISDSSASSFIKDNQITGSGTSAYSRASTTTTILGNQGYIAPGEVRTYSRTITSAADHHGAIISSLDNPFGQAVRITKVSLSLTTQAGAAATLDIGLSAANNDDPTTKLFTALPLNPGTTYPYLYNSLSNGSGGTSQGTQVEDVLWSTGSGNRYLNFFNPSGASDNGAVWTYTVTVMGN